MTYSIIIADELHQAFLGLADVELEMILLYACGEAFDHPYGLFLLILTNATLR